MQNLERRIAELEKKDSKQDMVIFIKSVQPGHLNTEVAYLADGKGNEWIRTPGEDEAEFKQRAKDEVLRNRYGVSMLFNFKADQTELEASNATE